MKYFLDIRNSNNPLLGIEFDGFISDKIIDTKLPLLIINDEKIFINKHEVGIVYSIITPDDMDKIMKDNINVEYIMIKTKDWHVIPLENLIAKFANSETKLIVSATNPQHLDLLKNILEIGIDICAIEIKDNYTVEDYLSKIDKNNVKKDLVEATVTHFERIGMGDRVCVDTCSILEDGEGILVGSTSAVMALVQAEVNESGFVNARPFRINAGVVASYTLVDEKTNYLSELRAGSQVMIVNRFGNARKEYVARIKIERRPLILIRVMIEEKEYPMIFQDAETVKLMQKEGSVRIDKIELNDKILVVYNKIGRHFGMAIDEAIEER